MQTCWRWLLTSVSRRFIRSSSNCDLVVQRTTRDEGQDVVRFCTPCLELAADWLETRTFITASLKVAKRKHLTSSLQCCIGLQPTASTSEIIELRLAKCQVSRNSLQSFRRPEPIRLFSNDCKMRPSFYKCGPIECFRFSRLLMRAFFIHFTDHLYLTDRGCCQRRFRLFGFNSKPP